ADMALCEVGTSAGIPGNRNDLHVLLTAPDGILRHTIRFTNDVGNWQPLTEVRKSGSRPPAMTHRVACAGAPSADGTDGDLHVLAVAGSTGVLWHSIRFGDTGNWQRFRQPPPPPSTPSFSGLAATVDSNSTLNVFLIDTNNRLLHIQRFA